MAKENDQRKKCGRGVFSGLSLTRGRSPLLIMTAVLVCVGIMSLLPAGLHKPSPAPHKSIFDPPRDESSREQNSTLGEDDLPPIVQVSPGANKYVLVRAQNGRSEKESHHHFLWFVKSATPEECGGKYHRHVAKDLVRKLHSLDLQVDVTGGGRIAYDLQKRQALVYGYSNRYGKGDHIKAAKLISKYTGIQASYNLSDSLY